MRGRKIVILFLGIFLLASFCIVPLGSAEEAKKVKVEERIIELEKEIISLKREIDNLKNMLELLNEDIFYLRWKGILPQGYLGIYGESLPGNKGVVVKKVVTYSPAYNAGLGVGDIILAYDDKKVYDWNSLVWWIHSTRPGTTVTLQISRREVKMYLPVRIGRKPAKE